MNVTARRTLKLFWTTHRAAREPSEAWYTIVSRAEWRGPADVTRAFGTSVDFVGDNRVVFDIGGNTYRPVVHFAYPFGRALIRFVGTHRDYDRIDVETIG